MSPLKTYTKTKLIARIEELEKRLKSEIDNSYSLKDLDAILVEERKQWEREHFSKVHKRDPETNRHNFKVLKGGAA